MATKPPRVGDTVTLPSGRAVRLTVAAERGRRWAAIETGWIWHVCREHGLEQPLVAFYFDPARRTPLQLDEADAKELAKVLNRVR